MKRERMDARNVEVGFTCFFFGWTISWRRCNRTDLRAVVHNALTHAVELIGCAQWSD